MADLELHKRKRVVITGIGAVTPLGLSASAFWDGLVNGVSGIAPMTLADPSNYSCRIAAEVKGFDPEHYMDRKEARRLARFSQLAVVATNEAMNNAELKQGAFDSERIGVLLGNGNGGYPEIDQAMRLLIAQGGSRLSPFHFPTTLPNMAAANLSRLVGAKGYSGTITTACAASSQSVGEAAEIIRRGTADIMISGGAEAGISELGLAGFSAMRALSTRNEEPEKASRPFDAQRDGFVPGEGAGILILESLDHALKRDAPIVAELIGFGCSSDAYHQFQPDEDGAGAARAIRWSLEDAQIGPHEVDYINAHGTSTPLNDSSETAAIKRTFGDLSYKIPISSTKSMIGHALGGAGGMEAVACVKTIMNGKIHPTINQETPDPTCDLDYVPNIARSQKVSTVLSNSFGFGGQNACIIFSAYTG